MNFSQLKAALNIDSNGNLDHHLKKLDTLIYLDAGGLYKLSDDGKEAIQAIEVMEAAIKPKKEPEVSAQANRVFYAFFGNHNRFSYSRRRSSRASSVFRGLHACIGGGNAGNFNRNDCGVSARCF